MVFLFVCNIIGIFWSDVAANEQEQTTSYHIVAAALAIEIFQLLCKDYRSGVKYRPMLSALMLLVTVMPQIVVDKFCIVSFTII